MPFLTLCRIISEFPDNFIILNFLLNFIPHLNLSLIWLKFIRLKSVIGGYNILWSSQINTIYVPRRVLMCCLWSLIPLIVLFSKLLQLRLNLLLNQGCCRLLNLLIFDLCAFLSGGLLSELVLFSVIPDRRVIA